MKRLLFGLVLLASPALAQDAVPQIPFEGSDPLKLPKDLYLGEVTGVAVNSKGHVFVLSRGNTTGPAYAAAAAQLLEFDHEGKFVREIGRNLYAWSFGHTVRVDKGDNIWVADKGSDMVVKFSPGGRVLLVFGRKQHQGKKQAFHDILLERVLRRSAPGFLLQRASITADTRAGERSNGELD